MMTIARTIARLKRALDRGQRGQTLIIFALVVVPVSLVIGVVAVDASMWQSERRGAQKDADLSALAGAIQLLDPAASASNAQAAATNYKTVNDQQANASFVQPPEVRAGCFGSGSRLDSVSLNINHATGMFFAGAFRIPVPKPGAHAKACAGSVTSTTGIVPFQIDTQTAPCYVSGKPQFGTLCGMEFGSNNGPNGNNPRGLLDLQASGGHCSDANGSGDPYTLIANGASGRCVINTNTPPSCDPTKNGPWDDCAAVQAGNTKKVLDAVKARIAREGACDANTPGSNHDGVDDFDEVLRLVYGNPDKSKRIYEPIDCDPNTDGAQVSPRLITIIVLSEPPTPGNDGNPIIGFAGFYLSGCSSTEGLTSDSQLTFDEKKCDLQGVQAAPVVSFGGRLASPPEAPDAADCDVGNKPTCTPVPPTSTPTKTLTPTPVSPTATPTITPTDTAEPCRTGPGNPHVPTCTPTPPLGNTETPTSTPGGPPPTATPSQPPGNNPGHDIVYGDFINLIVTNGDIGGFDPNTTLTGVTLVE